MLSFQQQYHMQNTLLNMQTEQYDLLLVFPVVKLMNGIQAKVQNSQYSHYIMVSKKINSKSILAIKKITIGYL